MEIIGLCGDQHHKPNVLVRLTNREMQIIAGGDGYANIGFFAGMTLDIHKRFFHSQCVLQEIDKAKKTSGQLRALADTLELAFPTLDAIAADPGSEVTA